MEKQEKIFVDGMRFELPNEIMKEKTPWIKAKISVKAPEFILFLEKHQNKGGYINIDLKKSDKTGGMYLELNTWKPIERTESKPEPIIDPKTGTDLSGGEF